jgi:hypothetical protein
MSHSDEKDDRGRTFMREEDLHVREPVCSTLGVGLPGFVRRDGHAHMVYPSPQRELCQSTHLPRTTPWRPHAQSWAMARRRLGPRRRAPSRLVHWHPRTLAVVAMPLATARCRCRHMMHGVVGGTTGLHAGLGLGDPGVQLRENKMVVRQLAMGWRPQHSPVLVLVVVHFLGLPTAALWGRRAGT